LRGECRLRVFKNRGVRRASGPQKDKNRRECRKLHNEELYDLYWSSDIIRMIESKRIRWARHVARLGERIGV
jgi:hypothetical protein